jgi:hypothetical protein
VKATVLLPIVVAVLVTGANVASADDVSDAIAAAQGAYAKTDYKVASAQLQIALVGVNQRLSDLVAKAMPDPPSGWTAEEPMGIDPSALGMGFLAGLMVQRTYHAPDGSSIEMTVAANSPLIGTFRMFLSNPKLAASMGAQGDMKKTTVCNHDAIEEFTSDSADIQILVGNTTLISVAGEDSSDRDHVRTLSNSTDCQAIVSIVE